MSTAVVASVYVKRMVEKERRGSTRDAALSRLERRYGLPFWTLNNLRIGRAKTVDASVFARIKSAYLDLCERELSRLQSEIEIAKAITEDDSFEDLDRETSALAARLAEKKRSIK